jgi:uncharacterized protein YneF (UPF0154 family)
MVPEWVGVFVLALGLGLVLGYWLAMPRVKVTEKALAKSLVRQSELEMVLEQAQAKLMWRE